MQSKHLAKMRKQLVQKRYIRLGQVKRRALQRSASAQPAVPGNERIFSFIPAEASLEVVSWPEL